MSAYISLIRAHIYKEDHIFFCLAAKEISAEEHGELWRAFEREREKLGGQVMERGRNILSEMESLLN